MRINSISFDTEQLRPTEFPAIALCEHCLDEKNILRILRFLLAYLVFKNPSFLCFEYFIFHFRNFRRQQMDLFHPIRLIIV